MGWTSARTWVNGELVTATLMNTHVKDNLAYLFSGRAGQTIIRDNNATYTTASTSFVDIDAVNLSITATISSGKALVMFNGSAWMNNAAALGAFDITVDGTRVGAAGTDGLAEIEGTVTRPTSICVLVTGLSVASHTFTVQWRAHSDSIFLAAGAGASTDTLPTLSVVEVG